MRKAIRALLSNGEDISVVGEASNFRETIQKMVELQPDLVILDVNMPDRNRVAPNKVKRLLKGARVLAITLGADDAAEELSDSVGAVKVLDKADLADQLIPAILKSTSRPEPSRLNWRQLVSYFAYLSQCFEERFLFPVMG